MDRLKEKAVDKRIAELQGRGRKEHHVTHRQSIFFAHRRECRRTDRRSPLREHCTPDTFEEPSHRKTSTEPAKPCGSPVRTCETFEGPSQRKLGKMPATPRVQCEGLVECGRASRDRGVAAIAKEVTLAEGSRRTRQIELINRKNQEAWEKRQCLAPRDSVIGGVPREMGTFRQGAPTWLQSNSYVVRDLEEAIRAADPSGRMSLSRLADPTSDEWKDVVVQAILTAEDDLLYSGRQTVWRNPRGMMFVVNPKWVDCLTGTARPRKGWSKIPEISRSILIAEEDGWPRSRPSLTPSSCLASSPTRLGSEPKSKSPLEHSSAGERNRESLEADAHEVRRLQEYSWVDPPRPARSARASVCRGSEPRCPSLSADEAAGVEAFIDGRSPGQIRKQESDCEVIEGSAREEHHVREPSSTEYQMHGYGTSGIARIRRSSSLSDSCARFEAILRRQSHR